MRLTAASFQDFPSEMSSIIIAPAVDASGANAFDLGDINLNRSKHISNHMSRL